MANANRSGERSAHSSIRSKIHPAEGVSVKGGPETSVRKPMGVSITHYWESPRSGVMAERHKDKPQRHRGTKSLCLCVFVVCLLTQYGSIRKLSTFKGFTLGGGLKGTRDKSLSAKQ